MGDDPVAEARTPSTTHGKPAARKVSRSKPLKRRSLLGAGGDSTPRALIPTDTKSNKDKEMAASFLQYCAMCEKQISHPSNNILYCSEACRRKDSAKPLSASTISISSPPLSPRATTPMRNTKSSSDYFTLSTRIPSDVHHFKSDLDPTEWKPKLPRSVSGASEAFRYLSRFHDTTKWNPNNLENDQDRPQPLRHKSTASMSTMTTPMLSLGNTPTTASTSFDSHYDFAFNLRPLPPRQNPLYSASTGHAKGIDLVTPHIPPPVDLAGSSSVPTDFDHDFWGKKVVVPGTTPRTKGDGLGALFGKEK